MAKPRIFVSSTYYDLKHIRTNIEAFIKQMGYEPVLFESGDIPFHHDKPLDESCYKEIENSHMQVLIIGGRYGSKISEEIEDNKEVEEEEVYKHFNSITKKEYQTAREKGIPIFIFVEKGVYAEYQTFKHNRANKTIVYAHVDNVNVFRLLDEIINQRANNFVKDFEHVEDIQNWLTDQWAGLFADFLTNKSSQLKLKNLSGEISDLKATNNALKEYTEAIMKSIKPDDYTQIIEKEHQKSLFRTSLRFKNEPMIKFILDKYFAENNRPHSKDLFLKFEDSNNIEDFLKSLKIKISDRNDFIEKNRTNAEKDYSKYKAKYFGEESENDLEESLDN
jgi:hypothetical protein